MKTAETELPGEAPRRGESQGAPGAPDIPDHEMIRLIGKGSYGEVWLARGVTGALRAVKTVSRVDFEFDRTFEREFEGIRQFEPISRNHPGLVNIFHIGRNLEKGFYYYVMELGDDRTTGSDIHPDIYKPRSLSTDIQQHKRLKMDDCVRFGAFLAEALHQLHEAGLAHRDIKPSNVIFVEGMPKLADIGLVAASGHRTFVGTEGFVPPEGPGKPAADIYSLGMVLYEMSTGKDRLDFPEVPGDFADSTERKKWRKLNEVICKACAQSPKRRFQDACEMAFAIERIEKFKFRPVPLRMKLFRVALMAGIFAVFIVLGKNADLLAALEANQTAFLNREVEEPPGIVGSDPEPEPGPGPVVVTDPGPEPPVPSPPDPLPKLAHVTISSEPPGAAVTINGEEWGPTPVTRENMPPGLLTGTVVLDGHKTITIRKELDGSEPIVRLGGNLERWNPPLEGTAWANSLGIGFRAIGERHVANRAVNEMEFEQFLIESGEFFSTSPARIRSPDPGIDTTATVIMVSIEAARAFCGWLTANEREEGFLTSMQRYVPEESIDYETLDFTFSPQGIGFRRLAIFLSVEEMAFATVSFYTEPEVAAEVVLGENVLGTTPFTKRDLEVGEVTILVRADGYKPKMVDLILAPGEERDVTVLLEKSFSAVLGQPWENTLGMQFVPFGEDLLVSKWETRVGDLDAFCREREIEAFHRPVFPQEPDHPAVLVSWEDAVAFCEWLTEREQAAGRLEGNLEYRLPTDSEWSVFCGLVDEPGNSPSARDGRAARLYPWGEDWPPPGGAANLADVSARGGLGRRNTIEKYDDGFPKTAPVGKFDPNPLGIHDLAGNVWEWVADPYGGPSNFKDWAVARGGGYSSASRTELLVSYRNTLARGRRYVLNGFRCVIARVDEEE